MFESLEGEGSRGEGVERNGYPLLYLDVFKIKKGGIISLFIVCNFVNMVRVNLVIYLVKHFYTLLLKNERNHKKHPNKVIHLTPPLENIQTS